MERSMVFAKGAEITPADLPGHLMAAPAAPQSESAALSAPVPGRPLKDALKTSISTIEKDYIIAALREEGSNRTNAAKRLGISRKGLQLKIKEYGLEQY
jgi:two-component system response regulator HydG